MTRVLITGGFGYVGGRLADVLADRSITRASRSPRTAAALYDPAHFERLCEGHDVVVHLAAMGEPATERDPEGALSANVEATLRLMRAAKAAGVRRVVYASTSKVFGQNPVGTITEASLPRPTSHYALTHRMAEDYVLASGMEGIVLRLSNSLGAPADADAPVWSLISNDLCRRAAIEGQVVVKSSGLQWRNFVAMADVVSAIRHLIDYKGDLGDGIFHVGGPAPLRIRDLAEMVTEQGERVLGRRPTLSLGDALPGESHPVLDWRTDKLCATGWAAATPLADEIAATIRFCRERFTEAPCRA
jgi:UDP-glucose 4-epimerase